MKEKQRKLYKIGDLAERLGITHRTIRYYDQMGLLPHVKRSDGNVRLFDEEDVEIISKIRRMQQVEFLPLDVIKERLFGKKSSVAASAVVLTDSTAALPKELIGELQIEVVPLKVHLGDKDYLDSVNITTTALWEKMRKEKIKPTTSPPSVEDFEKKYLELHAKGFKRIYSIHLSSTLSQTVINAQRAAEKVSDRVEVMVVDSKSTGAGLGLFVRQIGQAISKGDSPKEIELLIAKQLPLIYYLVSVNSLRYLVSGGYIQESDNSARNNLLAKLMDFKPVFFLKPGNGEIDIIRCCKQRSEAMELMLDLVAEEVAARGNYINGIMINYNYMYGEALEVVNQIKNRFPKTPIYLEESCAVLSAYVGPETLSISIA